MPPSFQYSRQSGGKLFQDRIAGYELPASFSRNWQNFP
jgi:hypothetical protein